jgi:alpha-galactosidase
MFNRSAAPATVSLKWAELGLKASPKKGRDLWTHRDVMFDGAEYSATVPSHGVVMLRVAE